MRWLLLLLLAGCDPCGDRKYVHAVSAELAPGAKLTGSIADCGGCDVGRVVARWNKASGSGTIDLAVDSGSTAQGGPGSEGVTAISDGGRCGGNCGYAATLTNNSSLPLENVDIELSCPQASIVLVSN